MPHLHPTTQKALTTALRLSLSVISCFLLFVTVTAAQGGGTAAATMASITGTVLDDAEAPLAYANVVISAAADSSIVKVEVSGDDGKFIASGLAAGRYFVSVKYVGLPDADVAAFELGFGESRDLGTLNMREAAQELQGATVTARRAIVEIKADRTVFNVEGTINAAGGDGLSLLRKAPGVVLDNNNNVIVMGRQGVLIYIDGKRSPLSGEALTAYLRSLPAEQIDRIDIITNPGAKYEAEGNAGIIDIRLKKNESFGSNGSVSLTTSQAIHNRSNLSGTVNHRDGKWNTFATGGVYSGANSNLNFFKREQKGIYIDDKLDNVYSWQGGNVKFGSDFRMSDKHTLGFQVNGNLNDSEGNNTSRTTFSQLTQRSVIDSILIAGSFSDSRSVQVSGNLNYRYDDAKGTTVNVDVSQGAFRNQDVSRQPNQFYGPNGEDARSRQEYGFDTPSDIDITTLTLDWEAPLKGGKFGAGAKYTKVASDNDFRLSTMLSGELRFDAVRSNRFYYDEGVAAGYVNYNRDFGPASPAGQGKTYSFTAGLRAEHTRALGELKVYDGGANTMPVDRDYVNLFPNAGLTWAAAKKHQLALSYGRRINRPDYGNLNPFLSFASLVTFQQGNPTLRPEIVNNLELAHTFAYRYTTKLSYSRTSDQITQLVRPDERDERATYITFDNLANQEVVSLNVSIPAEIRKWWEVYFSGTASHISNQATYPDGATIDLQALTYNIYAQNTFKVGKGYQVELSGWFSGPGIWAGTFVTKSQGALNAGVQKKFMEDKLKVRLAVDDIFYTSKWRATSNFAGQIFTGGGQWESRRASLSLSYNFGNQKVKVRQRSTGLEDAAGRVGGRN